MVLDTSPMSPLHLSPSVGHAYLMRRASLQLTYRGGDVSAWQRRARRKLRELLAVPENTHQPLRVRRLWRKRTELGVIEKIVFRSEPGVDVPCYWCVPHDAKPPYRTFICLQGHTTGMHNSIAVDRETEKKSIEVSGDRDFALGCMCRGLAALCVEQRSFGTRRELVQKVTDPGCHDADMRALLLGRTLLGERVFDVDRAIDYLESRGDVDMSRLGLMGNSGGGTTTMNAAALLPRVKAAMPSCATARIADSIASIHHCSCNTIPGVLQWLDMGDILGCIVPRPLVIVAGRTDSIFPIASARATYRHVKRIYTAAGAGDKVKFVEGPDGHRFYADLGWPVMLKMLGTRG